MALANVAVLQSQWGYKVLIVDWDLEAPGIENYFQDYLPPENVSSQKGIIDILEKKLSNWQDFRLIIKLPQSRARLHLLTAGDRGADYLSKVRNFDTPSFYTKSEGGIFIETLRDEWKKTYDYILVDSRTGITDIGGICTIQLPDILVLLFTATKQSFYGAISVAEKANLARQKLPYDRLNLIAVPIPSRFDSQTEFKLSQEWLGRFSRDLSKIYSNWLPKSVSKLAMLQITQIPYVSYFSYGEKLPVLEQGKYMYSKVRIFVASPGDVVEERNRVKLVVEELNRSVAHRLRLILEILDWRTHVAPLMGRPDEVIFEQAPIGNGDIFIGILWARFGTPSGTIDPLTGSSFLFGTEEEFVFAQQAWQKIGRPQILLYRCVRPVNPDELDFSQLHRVQNFFDEMSPGGKYPSLYQTYETAEDFEHRVREHLIKVIFDYSKERLSRNFQPDLAKELDKLTAASH